jgi:hypothetical protein
MWTQAGAVDAVPTFHPDDPRNLAAVCYECNVMGKRTQVGAWDDVTGTFAPLFNPRTQPWDEHFVWVGDYTVVLGRTPTGRATVRALQLNNAKYRAQRKLLRAAMRAGEPVWP